jgi:hypothetical protein
LTMGLVDALASSRDLLNVAAQRAEARRCVHVTGDNSRR